MSAASLPARDRPVPARLARPAAALAARDRRDRVDRHVLLLRPARPVAARAEEPRDAADGVLGELWEVHGGGFYKVQKYRVAPPVLPDHLAWFKWEAYATWLSGFGLMVVLYYLEANATLIDPRVADLEPWQAVALSVGLLVAAWVVYDVLCRVLEAARARALGRHPGADRPCGLGLERAVRAAGSLAAGGGDARHRDGRERPLRDHPRTLGADPRQAGGPRARPVRRAPRQAALGAQQLPDAPGAADHARRATSRSSSAASAPG